MGSATEVTVEHADNDHHPLDGARRHAERLAREAGAIALRHRADGVAAESKDGGEPVTAADREINQFLEVAIGGLYPDDAILAEESPPDPRRFHTKRTWMLDPIDGTREYIAGTENWEVMIGLVDDGEPVLGVIYNACTDTMISAVRGGGATITRGDDRRDLVHTPTSTAGPKTMLVRLGATPDAVRSIADTLGVERIEQKGGFGARALYGLDSGADIVLNLSGAPREWDTCALQIAAEESGAAMLNCRGERFTYNKPDPTQHHGMVLTGRAHLDRVLAVVVPAYDAWAEHRTS